MDFSSLIDVNNNVFGARRAKAVPGPARCASVINPRCNVAISPNAAVNNSPEQKVGLEADYSPDDGTASLN